MTHAARRLAPLALAALLAAPALAQEAATPDTPAEEPSGLDLIGAGAGQILQGLRNEAAPALDGLQDLGADVLPTVRTIVTEMGPGFFTVFSQVDSLANYDAPAFEPNGDIVVRRSPGAPEWTPPAPE